MFIELNITLYISIYKVKYAWNGINRRCRLSRIYTYEKLGLGFWFLILGRVPHLHQILLLILIAPTIQVILLGILGYNIKYPNWYLVWGIYVNCLCVWLPIILRYFIFCWFLTSFFVAMRGLQISWMFGFSPFPCW